MNADRRGGTATSVAVGPKNAASSAAGDALKSPQNRLHAASIYCDSAGTC